MASVVTTTSDTTKFITVIVYIWRGEGGLSDSSDFSETSPTTIVSYQHDAELSLSVCHTLMLDSGKNTSPTVEDD